MTIKKKATTERRASAGRLAQGACPMWGRDENDRRTIKEIQYPSGTTTEEKLAMLEAAFRKMFTEAERSETQKHRSINNLHHEIFTLREQHDAALKLVRAMIPAPSKSSQFDDDIPF